MNSRTVIEEPTTPPSDSSLKISASRAFSAPFFVLASTVWKVRTVSPVTGSTWERVTSHLSVLLRLRNPLLVYLRLCIFEASFRGLASCPGFCRGRRTRPDRQNGNGRRVRGARRGGFGETPESRAASAFSTPSFNRHCDRQFDRHLTDKTGLEGETKENEAGCQRREKTRIRSSAWCLQKPQTSQNFEKPQVKPLITRRSLVQIQPPRPNVTASFGRLFLLPESVAFFSHKETQSKPFSRGASMLRKSRASTLPFLVRYL